MAAVTTLPYNPANASAYNPADIRPLSPVPSLGTVRSYTVQPSGAKEGGPWIVFRVHGETYLLHSVFSDFKEKDPFYGAIKLTRVTAASQTTLALTLYYDNQTRSETFGVEFTSLASTCGYTNCKSIQDADKEQRSIVLTQVLEKLHALVKKFLDTAAYVWGPDNIVVPSKILKSTQSINRLEAYFKQSGRELTPYISRKDFSKALADVPALEHSYFRLNEERDGKKIIVLKVKESQCKTTDSKDIRMTWLLTGEPVVLVGPKKPKKESASNTQFRSNSQFRKDLKVAVEILKLSKVKLFNSVLTPIDVVDYQHRQNCKNKEKYQGIFFQKIVYPYLPCNFRQFFEGIKGRELPSEHKDYIFYRITEGVAELHERVGFAHRDVNPKNIMLNPETWEIRVIDWGFTQSLETKYDSLDTLGHTKGWVPPEVIKDIKEARQKGTQGIVVDPQAYDAFTLGMVLFAIEESKERLSLLSEADFLKEIDTIRGWPMPPLGTRQWVMRKLLSNTAERITVSKAFEHLKEIYKGVPPKPSALQKDGQGGNCIIS